MIRAIALCLMLSLMLPAGVAGSGTPPAASAGSVIRVAGSDLNGLMLLWEADFAAHHPEVRFENRMASGDAAIGALEAGAADIVANGREPVLTEFLSFAEVFGNDGPFQVTVATGSPSKLGRTWAQVVYVNRANPIAHMSMAQLEGVFGGARTGGYAGYRWTTSNALPEPLTIRRWGRLGLSGSWRTRPIHTYGYAPTGMSNFFEATVLHGGASWAPGYRQYVEASAKQAGERAGTTDAMMDELEKDPGGIAWAGIAHARGHPNVKAIALRWGETGPFVDCTDQTVADRSYPLTRSVFIQMNRPPGTVVAPTARMFLEYVLSPEGQAVVSRQNEYVALPPEFAARQRHLLE